MNLFLLSSLFQAHWPKRTSQNLINPISSLPPIQPPQPGERPGDRRCAVVDSAPPHAVPAVRGPRPAPPPSTPRTATPPGAPDEDKYAPTMEREEGGESRRGESNGVGCSRRRRAATREERAPSVLPLAATRRRRRQLSQACPLENLRHVKRVRRCCEYGEKSELSIILCLATGPEHCSEMFPQDVKKIVGTYELNTFIAKAM
uniref:Uncharacterized protein n=1 Tax=Oryza meridionalis TaxID=40149 RepID=A0A0E0DB65_9ORYZ